MLEKLFKPKKITNSLPYELGKSLYGSYLFNDLPIANFLNLDTDLMNGYRSNEVVYSIINKIANTASFTPLLLKNQNDDVIDTHWAVDLINQPNEDDTFIELYRNFLIYYLSIGGSYLYAPLVGSGARRELWILPATKVVAISGGPYDPIKAYRLYIGTQEINLPEEDVFKMYMFNPVFEEGQFIYPLSPISVAANIINNLNAGEQRMQNMLETGLPPFILSAKSGEGLTEKQQEMLEKSYEEKYEKNANSKKPLLSGIELKVDKIGFSAQDLSLIENYQNGLRVVCNVYGVDSKLFNDPVSSTYNNVKEVKETFYNDVILPLNTLFAEKLTKFLVGSEGLHFEFDYSGVPVLAEAKLRSLKEYDALSFMTKNEKREAANLPPIEGGDDFIEPTNIQTNDETIDMQQ